MIRFSYISSPRLVRPCGLKRSAISVGASGRLTPLLRPPSNANLRKTALLSPDFAVVKTFASLASRYPYEAVGVVHLIQEGDRDGWSIHGWNEHLDAILKAALRNGETAKKEAVATIDLLAARGFRG